MYDTKNSAIVLKAWLREKQRSSGRPDPLGFACQALQSQLTRPCIQVFLLIALLLLSRDFRAQFQIGVQLEKHSSAVFSTINESFSLESPRELNPQKVSTLLSTPSSITPAFLTSLKKKIKNKKRKQQQEKKQRIQ